MIMHRIILSLYEAIRDAAAISMAICGFYDLFFSGLVGKKSAELVYNNIKSSLILFGAGVCVLMIYGLIIKHPNHRLKATYAMPDGGPTLYSFAYNPYLKTFSVVEICRKDKENRFLPYAIAFVDMPNELDKRQMVLQHKFLYNKGKYYNVEKMSPPKIDKKEYKNFYYREFITNDSLNKI